MEDFVGLDKGKHSVRAVALRAEGKGFDLVALQQKVIDENHNAATAIQNIFDGNDEFPKMQVWAGLPIDDCVLRNMRVPFTSDDQIKQTIKFSCEEVIHDDIDNYLLDHFVISKTEENSDILIVAGKRAAVSRELEQYLAAGLDLEGLTCSKLALYNLAAAIEKTPEKEDGNEEDEEDGNFEDKVKEFAETAALDNEDLLVLDTAVLNDLTGKRGDNFLVLDIGISTADVIVGNKDKLLFYRGISTKYDGDGSDVFDEIKIDRLFKEIKRSLFSGKVAEAFSRVYICGGISTVPGIVDRVLREFNCQSELMPVHKAFSNCVESKDLPLYAQAAGLALMATRKCQLDINFRREEFLRTPLLLQIKYPLILSLVLILTLLSWEGYRKDRIKKNLAYRNIEQENWQITWAKKLLATDKLNEEIFAKDQELVASKGKGGQRTVASRRAFNHYLEDRLDDPNVEILPESVYRDETPEWLEAKIKERISDEGGIREKPDVLDTLKNFLKEVGSFKDLRLKSLSVNHNHVMFKGSFSSSSHWDEFELAINKSMKKSVKFKINGSIPQPKWDEKDKRLYFNLTVALIKNRES
jgi:Tfp pilus assembly PilM family ATPase